MEKGKDKNSGLGIAALVLSIIGIVFCFIPYVNFISYICCVLALIFSIISLIKKSKKALPIAAIILSVIALVMASVMNTATTEVLKDTSKELDKATGGSTEEVLKNDINVTLGKLEVTTDEWGLNSTQLVVTVKNITDKKISADLHIEAKDASGNRINDDYVYINDLGAGQTTTDKIFEYIEDENLEAMKAASIEIVEASVY